MVQALFPRKGELDREFDTLYRISIAIGLSIVITILTGFALNFLGPNPDTGIGYFTTGYIVLTLLSISFSFFLIGWLRGAFPILGKWHPVLIRNPPPDPRSLVGLEIRDRKKAFHHRLMVNEKFQLLDAIEDMEKKEAMHSGEMQTYYRKKQLDLQKKLKDLEAQIWEMENSERMV